MKLNTLTVGNTQVKNNIFLAPMAGYTDYCIRKLQISLGIGLAFTELVSAKGLMYGSEKANRVLLRADGDEDSTSAQIFGSDPYFLRKACESDYLKPFSIIDINMGCPVPKVFKNGEGSALLTDIKKAENIIKECVKSGKNISIKIRIGQKKGDDIASDFAKMAEQAGACMVTIHGRVREDYYSGEPNFDAIARAKQLVKIPIIANGGVFTIEDAENMLDKTGADGIMLARGAIANPFLVCELLCEKPNFTLKEYIIEHVKLMSKLYDDKRAALEFRKFTPYYFKGMSGVKELKLALQQSQSTDEIINLIEQSL